MSRRLNEAARRHREKLEDSEWECICLACGRSVQRPENICECDELEVTWKKKGTMFVTDEVSE